jgi:hypothetical protein
MRRRNITSASAIVSRVIALGALSATIAHAELTDPVGQADIISIQGVARVADEAGDARLASWLKQGTRRDLAAIALRASPFAHAPERLVPALASILCGRDPVLAPESAHALWQISERITPDGVAAREADLADFSAARKALECARQDQPALRPDLTKAALVLDAALAQLAP